MRIGNHVLVSFYQPSTTYQADEEPGLFGRSTRRGVGDDPGRLLARLELSLAENIDQNGEDIGVDHRLKTNPCCRLNKLCSSRRTYLEHNFSVLLSISLIEGRHTLYEHFQFPQNSESIVWIYVWNQETSFPIFSPDSSSLHQLIRHHRGLSYFSRKKAMVDLNLLMVAGGDIGDGPARLLADRLLGRAE